MEDHADQLHIAVFGVGYQSIAGIGSVAGLAGHGIFIVFFAVFQKHTMAGLQMVAVGIYIGRTDVVGGGGGNLRKRRFEASFIIRAISRQVV